jgi:hypothetical protein
MSTLAGSLVCGGKEGSPSGLIAYADSEFVYGDSLKFHSSQSKWQIFLGPGATILMSGSGAWNYARMAIEQTSEAFKAIGPDIQLTLPSIKTIVEQVLVDLYDKHFKVISPQPMFDIILAVRQLDGVTGIIKSDMTAVTVSYGHDVTGSGTIIATCLAEIFYDVSMSIKEGALLAALILWVANKYAQGVGGRSTIIALTDDIDIYEAAGLDTIFQDLHSAVRALWSELTRPDASPQDLQKTLMSHVKSLRKVKATFNKLSAASQPWIIKKVSN